MSERRSAKKEREEKERRALAEAQLISEQEDAREKREAEEREAAKREAEKREVEKKRKDEERRRREEHAKKVPALLAALPDRVRAIVVPPPQKATPSTVPHPTPAPSLQPVRQVKFPSAFPKGADPESDDDLTQTIRELAFIQDAIAERLRLDRYIAQMRRNALFRMHHRSNRAVKGSPEHSQLCALVEDMLRETEREIPGRRSAPTATVTQPAADPAEQQPDDAALEGEVPADARGAAQNVPPPPVPAPVPAPPPAQVPAPVDPPGQQDAPAEEGAADDTPQTTPKKVPVSREHAARVRRGSPGAMEHELEDYPASLMACPLSIQAFRERPDECPLPPDMPENLSLQEQMDFAVLQYYEYRKMWLTHSWAGRAFGARHISRWYGLTRSTFGNHVTAAQDDMVEKGYPPPPKPKTLGQKDKVTPPKTRSRTRAATQAARTTEAARQEDPADDQDDDDDLADFEEDEPRELPDLTAPDADLMPPQPSTSQSTAPAPTRKTSEKSTKTSTKTKTSTVATRTSTVATKTPPAGQSARTTPRSAKKKKRAFVWDSDESNGAPGAKAAKKQDAATSSKTQATETPPRHFRPVEQDSDASVTLTPPAARHSVTSASFWESKAAGTEEPELPSPPVTRLQDTIREEREARRKGKKQTGQSDEPTEKSDEKGDGEDDGKAGTG